MNWKQVSVLTEGICIEAMAGIFHRLGSGGVVIEDPQSARKFINKHGWKAEAVSPDFLDHEFVVVRAYFPENRDVMNELHDCILRVEKNFQARCRVFIDEVKDEDWEDSWKKYYHTFKVGSRLVIKPSWEEYQAADDQIIVEIDPGMAFGTGIHASTRFCLRFIDEYVKGGEKIVDAGCGSGILSIAAALLGAEKIVAMDVDELAVDIARENVALNNLPDRITVKVGDAVEELAKYQADMILANITAEVVTRLIPEAARVLRGGGYLFGSGIVEGRWPGVKQQLESSGFVIEQVLTDIDWVGVAARKL